jgi:hypothetical protein
MLVIAGVALVAWGLLMSVLAGRFGLDRFCWGIVGAALGPLALMPFVGEVRASRRSHADPAEPASTQHREREQSVLARGGRQR